VNGDEAMARTGLGTCCAEPANAHIYVPTGPPYIFQSAGRFPVRHEFVAAVRPCPTCGTGIVPVEDATPTAPARGQRRQRVGGSEMLGIGLLVGYGAGIIMGVVL